jgi:hypothetical protein
MKKYILLVIFITTQLLSADNIKENTMQISIQSNRQTIIYKLNNSQAAIELYNQLPMEI